MNKEELSEDFAVKILNIEKILRIERSEKIASYQVAKSGTSIGANIAEAVFAESDQDYVHKLAIAQKECNETLYWLRVLNRTHYITKEEFDDLYPQAESLMKIITSIIVKIKKNNIF